MKRGTVRVSHMARMGRIRTTRAGKLCTLATLHKSRDMTNATVWDSKIKL
jgi:hypothetical protein